MSELSWIGLIVMCWVAAAIVVFGERLTWLALAWEWLKVALMPWRWRRG